MKEKGNSSFSFAFWGEPALLLGTRLHLFMCGVLVLVITESETIHTIYRMCLHKDSTNAEGCKPSFQLVASAGKIQRFVSML